MSKAKRKAVMKRAYRKNLVVRRGWAVPVICVWCLILLDHPIFWGSMTVISSGLYLVYVDKVTKAEAEKELKRYG